MLSLAALAFSVSAVSFLSNGERGSSQWVAVVAALAAAASSIAAYGAVQGLLVTLILAMTVASVLVLVLEPRPGHARTVAIVSGLFGLVPALLAGAMG
ncbi:hypothetical protein [Archangium violaceum]|uniref:hypothetical protein n=1 Tax=Archangium violaceum TaxID=83451 RepID=UPI0036DEDFEC